MKSRKKNQKKVEIEKTSKEREAENYQELKETFPQENYEDRHTWQDTLQWRWEAVKMDALRNGTLSIHFDQTALNELLSNLKMILG